MTNFTDVLRMLCPNSEYISIDGVYENIDWCGKKAPITKKQFQDGFAQYEAFKAQQDSAQVEAKATAQAKLAALGLTVEDLQALGL
jgi:hypothetical protein